MFAEKPRNGFLDFRVCATESSDNSVERAVNASAPLTQPRDAVAALEPLGDLVRRDLQRKAVNDGVAEEAKKGGLGGLLG